MNKNPDYEKLNSYKEDIEYFTCKCKSATITEPCAAEYTTMIKKTKEKFVLEVHKTQDGKPRSIYEQNKKIRGKVEVLWATKVDKTHTITAKDYDALIEKLYDYYVGVGAINLETNCLSAIFPKALKYWEENHRIDPKTSMEYIRVNKKFYLSNPISKRNIISITRDDWREFFEYICKEYELTKKNFSQARIVATIIDTYAVRNNLIPYSRILGIDYEGLPYAKDKAYIHINAKAFTETQKDAIINWCDGQIAKHNTKDIYYYAIMFNLEMGLRFAELVALTWEKIDFSEHTLTVDCQAPLDYERKSDTSDTFKYNGRTTVDHMKAYENPRVLFIPDRIMKILTDIQPLCSAPEKLNRSEKIFANDGFRYHTYNEKIKKAATDIGLLGAEYRTHSLRATAATLLYRKCKDIKTVQYFLGHTTPEMTAKYIKQVEMVETLKGIFLAG